MTQKSLALIAKVIIIIFALLGVAFYGLAIPLGGLDIISYYPEFSSWYVPWLVFAELMLIPEYAVLVLAWQIASSFPKGNAFAHKNAARFKAISMLALGASGYFFAGNIVFGLLAMSHPSMLLVSIVLTFIGVSIGAAAAILAYFSDKAADLREESELTI